MKAHPLLLAVTLFCSAVSLLAADKIVAGPKGGRLLDVEPQKAEFLVTADRKVEVIFYDTALAPVAPSDQVVTVTAEPKSGKAPLELEKTAKGFVSKLPLPPGEPYRVVVQVRERPDAKPKNFRIDLNLAACETCHHAEYACTCEGH